jgi:hypothetical protein
MEQRGHGLKPPLFNTYDLSRVIVGAYLHLNRHVAIFAQLGRFDAIGYAGLETLENLIEVYPAVVVNPTADLAFRFGPEVLWRPSVYDAVYISRTTPLLQTVSATDTASYIGTNLVATAQWRIMTNVSLFAEYLHELAGPAITLAGGHGADVGIVQIDANF